MTELQNFLKFIGREYDPAVNGYLCDIVFGARSEELNLALYFIDRHDNLKSKNFRLNHFLKSLREYDRLTNFSKLESFKEDLEVGKQVEQRLLKDWIKSGITNSINLHCLKQKGFPEDLLPKIEEFFEYDELYSCFQWSLVSKLYSVALGNELDCLSFDYVKFIDLIWNSNDSFGCLKDLSKIANTLSRHRLLELNHKNYPQFYLEHLSSSITESLPCGLCKSVKERFGEETDKRMEENLLLRIKNLSYKAKIYQENLLHTAELLESVHNGLKFGKDGIYVNKSDLPKYLQNSYKWAKLVEQGKNFIVIDKFVEGFMEWLIPNDDSVEKNNVVPAISTEDNLQADVIAKEAPEQNSEASSSSKVHPQNQVNTSSANCEAAIATLSLEESQANSLVNEDDLVALTDEMASQIKELMSSNEQDQARLYGQVEEESINYEF
jgi:hypothetical protein